jgi:hypothetical protein
VAIVDDYAGIAEGIKRLRLEPVVNASDVTVRAGRTSIRENSLLADILRRKGIKLPRQGSAGSAGWAVD